MKVVAISDMHGQLIDPDKIHGDILCICGDTFPLNIQWKKNKCEAWLIETFVPWANSLDVKEVFIIAGNHDIYFEKALINTIYDIFKDSKVTYLENEMIVYEGLKIYGTPYCHQYGNWAFMRDDERLTTIFENIPNDLDILLTHDAPYGTSDICYQAVSRNNGDHLGCLPLRDAILRANPKFVLHGHLHSTNHAPEQMGNRTEVFNVSLLDEQYDMVYEPLNLAL